MPELSQKLIIQKLFQVNILTPQNVEDVLDNDISSTSNIIENHHRLNHGNMEFQKLMEASFWGSNHSMCFPRCHHHSLSSTSTSNDPFASKVLFSNIPRRQNETAKG